jgi:hypothetical protein
VTETPSPTHTSASPGGEVSHPLGGGAPPGVDVQQLANKVYDLLLAEARLGRARGDSPLIAQRNGEG